MLTDDLVDPDLSWVQRARSRVGLYLAMQRRAIRYRIPFRRRRGFQVPDRLRVGGRSLPLFLPDERGCANDFINIFLTDSYGLEQIRREVPDCRSIVDVGANVGLFSIAARAQFPTAQIEAYEPNVRVHGYIERNTGPLGVRLHGEAVGPADGMVEMVVGDDSNLGRTVTARAAGVIPMVAFSTVVERAGGSIDLLKLDCEGAEWALLDDPASWSKVRMVTMEYHAWARPEAGAQGFARALRGLGFEILRWLPDVSFGLILARSGTKG